MTSLPYVAPERERLPTRLAIPHFEAIECGTGIERESPAGIRSVSHREAPAATRFPLDDDIGVDEGLRRAPDGADAPWLVSDARAFIVDGNEKILHGYPARASPAGNRMPQVMNRTEVVPEMHDPLAHSPEQVEHWLHRVYGQAPGFLSVVSQDAGGTFHGARGTVPGIPAALARIARLDAAGAQGIYLRTTTMGRDPGPSERGGAANSLSMPGLWADVDFGTVGHKPVRGRLSLPPDEDEARRIVTESGLPDPSLWVHSGGGWYPWWLLDEPLLLTDDLRPMAADISARWQEALARSAERIGYYYGAGVGDLPRVLRIPGTVNRKAGRQRPCQVTEDNGTVYTIRSLMAALEAVAPATPQQAAPPTAGRPYTGNPQGVRDGLSAFDALDQYVTFDDILATAGFTFHRDAHAENIAQCWSRPDKPDNLCSAHTLKANPHVLVVFSEGAGLPTGGKRKLTRGRLFAHLHHGGNERAAALDLFAALGNRPSTTAAAALPLPRKTLRP